MFMYATLLVEYDSCCPHCIRSVEGLLWGAEPRFELGPAVQQANALQSEPHCTLSEPHRTLTEPHGTLVLRIANLKLIRMYPYAIH